MSGLQGRNLSDYEDRQAARTAKPASIGEVLQQTNPGVFIGQAVGLNTVSEDSPVKKPRPNSETCPRCGHKVDRLVPALDGSGDQVCLDCYTKGRQQTSAVAAPKGDPCGFCGTTVQSRRAPMVAGKLAHRLMCNACASKAENEQATAYGDTSHDRPDDPYCRSCFEPFTAKHAHQQRCARCAENTAALWIFDALHQWAVANIEPVPDKPKPPKLELVRQPEKLTPMVLWRAMWAQVWVDWQEAHNPAVLIRRLDANIKAPPRPAKAITVPQWEQWSEAEFRQKMVVPKVAA